MEAFLDVLGAVSLTLLVLIGLLSGWIASVIAGGHRVRYIVLGVVGAVALPFLLAALGVGILAAGGLIAILIAALIGAVIVLALARMLER
ncbi:Transglycosylase associated protein [Roseivivax lentus]|uniref:Transglycosylase associated protein n=1 Tax=Roseivivax lentus TaxID=633194 RepID=A0A1N7NG10_9RHOB|nr:GlsB/YeaQ/YmgE family stress response membrane protein [Roseivivax lentus]SIS97222.1 Transglycosylase associated protein [Roseivivax lentus]